MAYTFSTIFAYIVEMVGVTIVFSNIYGTKRKWPVVIPFGILVFGIAATLFLTVGNLYLNFLSFMVACFLYAVFMFDCTVLSSSILSVVLQAILLVSEFISLNVMSALFGIELSEYTSTDFLYFLTAVINKTLFFIICMILANLNFLKKDKTKSRYNKSKVPLFLLIYPFCTMFACILFWLMSYEYTFSRQISTYITVMCVMFLISIFVTYLLYNQAAKKESEVYILQSELERKEIDESYYKVLDYQNEKLRTMVHDEKNHLSIIKSLSSTDEIGKYVDKIYDDLDKYSSSGKTKNKMLDLILNKYKVLCEKEDIDFYINIRTANLSYIENTDLTSLLSNILDNAIEASKSTSEKMIDLSINRVNGSDMLTCVNSSDMKPVSVSGILKTTKSDKVFHGMGTKSIKRIVNKYKGEYEWDYDEKKKEFSVFVMFPTEKKE